MRLGVPKEIEDGEARVATTPQSVAKLIELGFSICVERGAGIGAAIPDQHFVDAGAEIVDDAWVNVDVVLKVNPPQATADGGHEADRLTPEMTLVSLVDPARNSELVERLRATGATVFALDQVPRITRAQKMDVLSSMANIAGYRAVVEAAQAYGGFFGGQITAAGKSAPARVLV
ncbi:MAG: NAD(P) transhydrogenase subunit alpha, partial [Kiritimatiellia bacterium]